GLAFFAAPVSATVVAPAPLAPEVVAPGSPVTVVPVVVVAVGEALGALGVVLAPEPGFLFALVFFFFAGLADDPSSSKLLASGVCSARSASASGPASGPPSPWISDSWLVPPTLRTWKWLRSTSAYLPSLSAWAPNHVCKSPSRAV